MLKRQILIYDNGMKTDEIIFTDGSSPTTYYPQKDGIRDGFLTTFKYKVKLKKGEVLSIVRLVDKTLLMPSNIEVHPKTTLEDVDVIQIVEKKKPSPQPQSFKFKSSTSKDIYTIKFENKRYTCNCSGFFRVKDKEKGCKHIQNLKSQLKNK